ncbi:ABC transporter substrate-binding protein [Radicibacter daui]|uniref:ABC transporter substrate-binding protein n=1 Tax=Radicibacter daui TaxID=3064829 RepID=UPI004046EFCC
MHLKTLALSTAAAFAAFLAVSAADASTLTINTDTSDPAPKAAMQYLIDTFKKQNPDVEVKWNIFDHEGYKTSIRNFLTAGAPDICAWYAGNRMEPFVKAGLFADISDVFTDKDAFKAALSSVTFDGKQYAMPYSYYQWGIYYRKDIFAKLGLTAPKTWDELLAVSKKLKENKITPFGIGTKATWTTGGWFDYLDLRTNGYKFHMDLTSGKVPYTDPKVKAVFDKWDELVKPGYFLENHPSYGWQEALATFVKGDSGMFLLGNFFVAPAMEAGLTQDQLGFFPFPEITKGLPRAEDAPTETLHMPTNAPNKADAKKFLALLATPEVQLGMNKILGQLPVNNKAPVPDDPYLKAGFEMLSTADGLAQFYDRDAPAEMAKVGMDGFQEYMVKPDRREQILERLEKARERIYK